MKKLKFLITVPDKYTGKQYEAGQIYEFTDERAAEILKARTAVTKELYAEEVIMPVVETVENIVEEKPKRKRTKKS